MRGIAPGLAGASCAVLAVVATIAAAASWAAGPKDSPLSSWPTYGGSLTSANIVAARGLTPATAARMRVSWARKLDGTIFAGPVVGVSGSHRRVVVATEAGTVYALDAVTGKVAWSRPITKPVSACGGTYGVSSTPTIDARNGVVYAIGASGYLTALSFADGSVRWRVRLVTRTTVEYVWSAPRVVGRSVYVAVASYCDATDKNGNPPDGYLLRVDLDSHKPTAKLDVVPGPNNLGGIWGWGGVSVDPATGSLFTSTGNSLFPNNPKLEAVGHAERVLRLTPALRVIDSTRQQAPAPKNLGDEDFGATPLLFHPSGCPPLVAANSKNGHTYVLRRAALAARPIWDATLGPAGSDDPFLGQPTYLPALRLLVVAQALFGTAEDPSRGLSAFTVGANCTFSRRWDLNIGGGPQPPPIAVGDVVAASAPASNDVKLVDARTGAIIGVLGTRQPVYAPLASDGTSIYVAATDGTIRRFAASGS